MTSDGWSGSDEIADDDLVVRAKTDRAAFARLYDRYYPRIAKYCLRRLFNRTVAEDVTSDVFLQMAASLREFSGRSDTDFRRWLFRIATNAVNAHLRQARRRQALWQEAAQSRIGFENDRRASTEARRDLLDWPAVYQALLELDERDQSIVTLRFFGGCSHEEIAEIVQATAGAVRTALSRSLSRLRAKLDPAVSRSPNCGLAPQE